MTSDLNSSEQLEFFKDVPKITEFVGVIDESNFYPAPEDWVVVVADVCSSTQAIAEGRYKDVNMVGGAVICAVQNATGGQEWPFVFGGDGATLLVTADALASIEAALVRTRTMARDDFNLELRIGFVPVSDLRKRGSDVLVARYEASPGNSFALFGGGGVELADQLIKTDGRAERYRVKEYSLPGLPDLTGLSCRWEPLPTQKGSILCLLIKPHAETFKQKQTVLSDFLAGLTQLLGSELSQASPVNRQSLKFSWPPKGLSAEAKATRADKPFWQKLIEIYIKSFIQWVMERRGLSHWGYDAKVYRDEMGTNSDYCKYDDVLRMVLDCTPKQVSQIRALLDKMHADGQIDFGFFETEQALMTCLLFDLNSSQHVHFIDGDNGGFTSASHSYKKQLASHESDNPSLVGSSERISNTQ